MKKDDKVELIDWKLIWVLGLVTAILTVLWGPHQASGHEIYTGVHGKNGQLCCGGNDCAVTVYRETGGKFEFLTRENHWVSVPEDKITFLPIPGDERSNVDYHESPNGDELHRAHLCYRKPTALDSVFIKSMLVHGDGQEIVMYCAFIPPGAT